ncbi:hypothetical protein AB5J52_43785 [Streptomyces sp. R39]|uniref:Sugar isomerase n=1 Tax=Streptomyces sp. R39 TaxID=3238631 RepID=A0AB39R6I3_9ACTN
MSHIIHELNSQPECWTRAAAQAAREGHALPAPGERVAIVGCGTSCFMAQAAATWMFGPAPAGLAEQVGATGGGLWIQGTLDPLAGLVRAQRLAVVVAAARGLDPDRPRHLTRSVILTPSGGE